MPRETLDALKAHLFNWKICLTRSDLTPLSYEEIRVRSIEFVWWTHHYPLPANHGASGRVLSDGSEASLVFTGDTTNDTFARMRTGSRTRYLIIETAFPSDASSVDSTPVSQYERSWQNSNDRLVCSSRTSSPERVRSQWKR
jgi:hypothetical protein